MTNNNFTKIIDNQLDMCRALLISKGEEYGRQSPDRLQAFKVAGQLEKITPLQALGGMMAKHTVSVYDLIKENCSDKNLWNEKITDHINYLLLLRALIEEVH